ncbi:MAG: hypothetical protein KDH97_25320, partial [Calditrichaeota bacterium]|nr:hypothetical protein [Calditrichota bacterium]
MRPYKIYLTLLLSFGSFHLPAQDSLNAVAALCGRQQTVTIRKNADLPNAPRFPVKPAKSHRQRL